MHACKHAFIHTNGREDKKEANFYVETFLNRSRGAFLYSACAASHILTATERRQYVKQKGEGGMESDKAVVVNKSMAAATAKLEKTH